jgi:hypothetical protein
MFKTMVLCSVAAGLAISLAACGESDEAKCVEMAKNVPDSPPEWKKGNQGFDMMVQSCIAARKANK